MKPLICGIQQMGIGVPNVPEIWSWYRTMFGMDVRVFEEAAEAPLMTRYTGGVVQARTATLALSMDGGGGFEIWQYRGRTPVGPDFEVQLGDLGLYAAKINDKVCPIVKSEINHITFFQFPNSYTTANAIKNNIWS